MSSAVTSADASAPRNVQSFGVRPFQKDSNTAFAPILTNNPLDGTHDMLRPVNGNRANPNLATPQVSLHDIKLYANRKGEEAQIIPRRTQEHITLVDIEAFLAGVNPLGLAGLELPTPADIEAFRSLNRQKDCKILSSREIEDHQWQQELFNPQFNVFQEYTGRWGKVAEELNLSPEEQAALWGYLHFDADIINHIARGAPTVDFGDYHYDRGVAADILCTLTKEDLLPWLKILQAGLNKMPSAAAGRLYRGVGFNAEGTPGSIAPITGFSSFSEDFNVAKCSAEENREDGIQPTIFVMDKHISGVQLEQTTSSLSHKDPKEVVFRVGTTFLIEEDEEVQREVEALWRENLASGAFYDWAGWREGEDVWQAVPDLKEEAVPDFKVLVVKEVPAVPDFKVLVVKVVPSRRGYFGFKKYS